MKAESVKLDIEIKCRDDYMTVYTLKETLLELEDGLYNADVKGKQVVDAGAYFGESSVFFSKMGAKEVYAYEPFSSFDYISHNAELNRCYNIQAFRNAIGAENKILKLDNSYRNTGSSRLSYASGNDDVQMITLEKIVSEYEIKNGVLKMDIEGSEFEAIEAASAETLRAFERMIIEIHALLGNKNKLVNKILSSGFDATLKDHPIHNEGTESGLYIIYAERI